MFMAMAARRRFSEHLFAGVKDFFARMISHGHDSSRESTIVLPALSSVVSISEIREGDKTVPRGARASCEKVGTAFSR
jgi:hypothetical protein